MKKQDEIRILKRYCPVCGGRNVEILYDQLFSGQFSHNIVCCKNCGFVFVNNIPDQKYYTRYYTDMSKYERERDYALHRRSCKIIKKFCRKSADIIDIGCAMGHLLYLLKKDGYANLFGIDPSPKCREIGRRKFGLIIKTADIFSFRTAQKYDFIILCNVLEHLRDVGKSINKITSLLRRGGYVFINVPDAENFHKNFDEPFGEFSTEHINFFSERYLRQLMQGYGCRYLESDNSNIYSVWQKTDSLRNCVKQYIKISSLKFKKINNIIESLPVGGQMKSETHLNNFSLDF